MSEFKKEIKRFLIKKVKRPLYLPFEASFYPFLAKDYVKSVAKSLPTTLILDPAFFKEKRQR